MDSQISKDKYYYNKDMKIEAYGKQITTNVYGITFTNEEYKNLVVAILTEISKDDTVLNVILQKAQMLKLQTSMTTNDIQKFIQNAIEKISTDGFQNGIKIELYESNGKLVRTRNRNRTK